MAPSFACAHGVFFLTTVFLVNLASAEKWEAALGWCHSIQDNLYQGDFNSDGRTDLLCHRTSDGYIWIALANVEGHFTGTSWEMDMQWCRSGGAQLYVGDFNGDGRDDMMCHNTISGHKSIAHANTDGNYDRGTTWEKDMVWCRASGAELFIGDFNSDNRDDMLCHHSDSGHEYIAYANCGGNFNDGTGWDAALEWCRHSESELHIGDFNGDTRDDMLCHDRNNGNKWIAYANSDGNFDDGTGWEKEMVWCTRSGEQLAIGDVNGDGRDDLFCHNTKTGHKLVALSNDQGNFDSGTSWEAGNGWCDHTEGQFFLGDYNRDHKSDMLCHDTSTGKKWIMYSIPFYDLYGMSV